MGSSSRDRFRNPIQGGHSFEVSSPESTLSDESLAGIDFVTIVSRNGSETFPAETVRVDRLRLNPKLASKSLRDTIDNANARWALEEVDGGVADA